MQRTRRPADPVGRWFKVMTDGSEEWVCVGAVAGARGLQGEVRIKSFTAEAKAIGDYGDVFEENGQTRYAIRITGRVKGQVLARLQGIDDRNAAEALKGTRLYVPKSALPKPGQDEFYFSDLVGLRADLMDGQSLGRVEQVHDFGAGAILEVTGGQAGLVMVPFTRAVVPEVDVSAGRVVIDPPPGLLDAPPPEARESAATDGEEARGSAATDGEEARGSAATDGEEE